VLVRHANAQKILVQQWQNSWMSLMTPRATWNLYSLSFVSMVLLSISDTTAPTLFDVPCQLYQLVYRVSSIWRSTGTSNLSIKSCIFNLSDASWTNFWNSSQSFVRVLTTWAHNWCNMWCSNWYFFRSATPRHPHSLMCPANHTN